MTTFTRYMSKDHHRCDELFAMSEETVQAGNWVLAEAQHRQFLDAMLRHFAMEEEALFPAIEAANGNPMGPTAVMRHEHEQMRTLFAEMSQALNGRRAGEYLGASENLLVLMRQHNAKEERILYPVSDNLLATQRESLLQKMQGLSGG